MCPRPPESKEMEEMVRIPSTLEGDSDGKQFLHFVPNGKEINGELSIKR